MKNEMKTDELKLITAHRPLAEIAEGLAQKDAEHFALKLKAKIVADGYKYQLEDLAYDLDRLRDEYRAANIASGNRVP